MHNKDKYLKSLISESQALIIFLWEDKPDPPIPPGATKFSYSTRLGEVKIKLCNAYTEFLELTVSRYYQNLMFIFLFTLFPYV